MTRQMNPVQVEKFLKGMDYPASKEDLIKKAKKEGADERVLETLRRMPGDTFQSPIDVSEAIGRSE
ncbi:DUF2795 domain-containing protein [Candidatus Woesearchaeota archaeon]|nr:DUF2795 domain-containing protein [Candidatus Woesearchaeota archaeon]